MSFHEKLEKRMKERNLTCGDIAEFFFMQEHPNEPDAWDILNYLGSGGKKYRTKRIENWRSGNAMPKSIDDLSKLCDILDCDFSYFFNDETIANLNNKKVADYLGIDEVVISHIKNYSSTIKKEISLYVRGEEFKKGYGDILLQILEILSHHIDNSSHTTITIENKATEKKEVLKGGDTLNYLLSDTVEKLEAVLLKICDIGISINRTRYEQIEERNQKQRDKELQEMIDKFIELVGEDEFYKNFPQYKKMKGSDMP